MVFRMVFSLLLFTGAAQFLWQKNFPSLERLRGISKKNIVFWLLVALFMVYLLATIFSADVRFSLWGSPSRSGGFVNYAGLILFAIMTFLMIKKDDWQKLFDGSIITGI